MSKLLIVAALLTPLVVAQDFDDFMNVGVIATSTNVRAQYHSGKTRWVLMEDKYAGQHPCAMDSACDCWLEEATLELTVNCSRRRLIEPPKMYKGLRVSQLDLSENALRRTPNMTGEGYDLVERLNLAGNRIENVTRDSISNNLKVLVLKDNKISCIDRTVLENIQNTPSIEWLDLENNPLVCDCKTVTLANSMRNSNISKLFQQACADADKRPKHLATNALCPGKLANYFGRSYDFLRSRAEAKGFIVD